MGETLSLVVDEMLLLLTTARLSATHPAAGFGHTDFTFLYSALSKATYRGLALGV